MTDDAGHGHRCGGGARPGALLSGVVVLLDAIVRFARADGTPAPPMPTAHLVVGPCPYVRNPMYLAVLSIVLGQALLFRSGGTPFYAGLFLPAIAGAAATGRPVTASSSLSAGPRN